MFNVEPQESWTKAEAAEFEEHVAARHKRLNRVAVLAGAVLLLNVVCVVPFLAGHSLHRYWNLGRWLIRLAMVLWLWFILRLAFVWSSWQSARETRREFGDAE